MRSVIIMIILCCAAVANSYDRVAVVDYAREFSRIPRDDDTGQIIYPVDWPINEDIYFNYMDPSWGGNCTNFGSQCLIAGGIRFRAFSPPNNNEFGYYAELETQQATRHIKSTDTRLYSRSIISALNLLNSIRHSRHGGIDYNTDAQKVSPNGDMWTSSRFVKEGDLLILSSYPAGHTMVISQVNASDTPKDFLYCCNSTSTSAFLIPPGHSRNSISFQM